MPSLPIAPITLNQIHASDLGTPPAILASPGVNASPESPMMKVSAIQLNSLKSLGVAHQYSATVEVSFNHTAIALRPAAVSILLQTDPNLNPGKETIVSCSPSSQTLSGFCTPANTWDNSTTLTCPVITGYTSQYLSGLVTLPQPVISILFSANDFWSGCGTPSAYTVIEQNTNTANLGHSASCIYVPK